MNSYAAKVKDCLNRRDYYGYLKKYFKQKYPNGIIDAELQKS